MNLGLFNELIKTVKHTNFTQSFIKELSNYINETSGGIKRNMENGLKEEDTLYQVVDLAADGVYLQNTKNNKISLEKDIDEKLKEKLQNDFILRYKEGKYIFEEKLTDEFFNDLIDIEDLKNYKKTNS